MSARQDDPETIARLIVWLDGYRCAAHGVDANIPYFNLIRRVLKDRERALRESVS